MKLVDVFILVLVLVAWVLLTIASCGCRSSPYVVNPPMRYRSDTGESWVFVQGYWIPVQEARIIGRPPYERRRNEVRPW